MRAFAVGEPSPNCTALQSLAVAVENVWTSLVMVLFFRQGNQYINIHEYIFSTLMLSVYIFSRWRFLALNNHRPTRVFSQ